MIAGWLLILIRPGSIALAEDPCPPDAPRHVAAVAGHTWSGTVTSAAPTGASKLGVADWLITFDVDRVYADRVDPNLPGLPIVVGHPFSLPSNTCGRAGDMGLKVGGRYLASTSSFADGTAIGSIVAWRIAADVVSLVPMYKTTAIGPEFAAPHSLDEVVALVVPGSVNPSESTTEIPAATPTGEPAPSIEPSTVSPSTSMAPVAVASIAVVVAAIVGTVISWRSRRHRSNSSPGGKE